MTQVQFERFSNMIEIIILFANTVLFLYLWDAFYRVRRYIYIVAGAIITVLLFIMKAAGLGSSCRLLIIALLATLYGFIRYGKNCQKSMLAAICFYGFRSLGWLISISAQQNVQNIVAESISGEVFNDTYIGKLYNLTAIVYVGVVVLYVLLFWAMIFFFRRAICDVNNLRWPDVAFLSVLNIVGSLFAEMVMLISIVPIEKEIFVLFDGRTPVSFFVPVMAALLYLGELAAVIVYKKYRVLLHEKELNIAQEQQLQAMKVRLAETEEFYGNIRKIRHEMRNHLENIRALAAGEERAVAEEYVEKLEKSVDELDLAIETGNAVTDVIVGDRVKRARNYDIKFDINWLCSEYGGIDPFDLGIILANLLDNAIEACASVPEDSRYIRLSFTRKRHFLIVSVDNSYCDEPVFGQDGLPLTTKPRGSGKSSELLAEHGVGLGNVKDIAERYFGSMDIRTEDGIFKVTVMVQG